MTFSTEQLLLAAQVQSLCIELRKRAFDEAEVAADMRHKTKEDLGYQYVPGDHAVREDFERLQIQHADARAEFRTRWYANNPVEAFVPAALRQLRTIATAMDQTPR